MDFLRAALGLILFIGVIGVVGYVVVWRVWVWWETTQNFEGVEPVPAGWTEELGKIARVRCKASPDSMKLRWYVKGKLGPYVSIRIRKASGRITSQNQWLDVFSATGSGETEDFDVKSGVEYEYWLKTNLRLWGFFKIGFPDHLSLYVKVPLPEEQDGISEETIAERESRRKQELADLEFRTAWLEKTRLMREAERRLQDLIKKSQPQQSKAMKTIAQQMAEEFLRKKVAPAEAKELLKKDPRFQTLSQSEQEQFLRDADDEFDPDEIRMRMDIND